MTLARTLTIIAIIVGFIVVSYFFVELPEKIEVTGIESVEIEIANFAFHPQEIMIKAGTAVVWTNEDLSPHALRETTGKFVSSNLKQGDSFSHNFNRRGTYNYLCTIHPHMKGTIIVI